MAAGVDGGVSVVAADLFFDLGVFVAGAFGEEDEIGPAEGIGGFAKDAAGKDVLVAERVLSVDEEEVEAVAEAEVLKAVVEKEGIGLVVSDGVAGGFDAVGVHKDSDAWEVAGEHEGLVAGLSGIEENRFSVGNNAGGEGVRPGRNLSAKRVRRGLGTLLYPRLRMATRRPASWRDRASFSTTGVFPVPPTVRLPTLITITPTE